MILIGLHSLEKLLKKLDIIVSINLDLNYIEIFGMKNIEDVFMV
nr:MAG TPA: hypothetical protein [Caudoviricetes sp.]